MEVSNLALVPSAELLVPSPLYYFSLSYYQHNIASEELRDVYSHVNSNPQEESWKLHVVVLKTDLQ